MNFLIFLLELVVVGAITTAQQTPGPAPISTASPSPIPPRQPDFTTGFGPERQAGEEDVSIVRDFVREIAQKIAPLRSKYSRDVIRQMDVFTVRTANLPGGDRAYLFKLQINQNSRDVWFINFYRVGQTPRQSHVIGVDVKVHEISDPLVEFLIPSS